jgi:hypothetical protein
MTPNNRGRAPDHSCYELGIPGDDRRYVGWDRGSQPWEALVPKPGSSLAAFLAAGAVPIAGTLPTLLLTRGEAVAITAARRRRARSEGLSIVHNHSFGGDRRARPVGPYASLRAAAAAMQVSRQKLKRMIAGGLWEVDNNSSQP